MIQLRGIAASPGIAIGPAQVIYDDVPQIPHYAVSTSDLTGELDRLNTALQRAEADVRALREINDRQLDDDELAVLDTHLLMLTDGSCLDQVRVRLARDLENVERVLSRTVGEMVHKLSGSPDAYLAERANDIRDVFRRVLRHLLHLEGEHRLGVSEEVVVVVHDLMPSDAVSLAKLKVRALVMDAGARTSHTAIIARGLEIPAVLGVGDAVRRIRDGQRLAVDGNRGLIVVDPDEPTVGRYRHAIRAWHEREHVLLESASLPAETTDGRRVAVFGNIEVPEEVTGVMRHGAEGIGLYRSEFLFLGRDRLPSEDEQYEAYARVLRESAPRPVTIRTLDVGGDKIDKTLQSGGEPNPILGWRAIRVCLSDRALFRTQLRALLRAGVHGTMRVMFPMISGVRELVAARAALTEASRELAAEGIEHADRIPVGAMIEVPSAALISATLAEHCDFFSIGTNDLIQYTLAVDRANEKTAYLYDPFHPAVLKLIDIVVQGGHAAGIPVAMCGEMAADPYAAAFLLGVGLDEFSIGAAAVPEIKRTVRALDFAAAQALAKRVLSLSSSAEITELLRERVPAPATFAY